MWLKKTPDMVLPELFERLRGIGKLLAKPSPNMLSDTVSNFVSEFKLGSGGDFVFKFRL